MRLRTTLLLAAGPLLLAACSSTTPTAPAANAAATSSQPSASPSAPAVLDASGVVAKLPIGADTVYTASSDPNHLLGRPNGYSSKAAFVDTRIKASDARDGSPGSVDLGGSVEVFGSNADATARQQYIQKAEKAMPMLGTEYDYVSDGVLLRISEALTPDQAKAYQSALNG